MLRKALTSDFETWAVLEGVPESFHRHFDHVVPALGMHSWKLNLLAAEICSQAADEDWIMFLDGDAFPLSDVRPLAEAAFRRGDCLVAVQRRENGGDVQPHPMFAVTTVKSWRLLLGDWSPGWAWHNALSQPVTDVGGNLQRSLARQHASWSPVHRTHQLAEHPVFFGVYGNLVYHHGASFRMPVTRSDHVRWRRPWPVADHVRYVLHRLDERRVARRNASDSQKIFQRLTRDPLATLAAATEVNHAETQF